jgi:hypothetical protein
VLPLGSLTLNSDLIMPRPKGLQPDWRPPPKTRALLEQVDGVLAGYRAHLPMTVRQVFYLLVGAYGYPKTEPYVTLSNTLIMARRAGRRLGCGIGRMSPTPRVGTIGR